jgi:hypothetical protein
MATVEKLQRTELGKNRKIPLGLGEYVQPPVDINRRSMNLPVDQFLLSGGSIDKYLKNSINTPKMSNRHEEPLNSGS